MRISDWSSDVCSSDLGLDRAIATAFTDLVIDKNAAGRVGVGAPFAAPTLFGGTGLIVNQHCGAFDLAQFTLDAIEFVAMVNRSEERRVGKECVSTCRYRGWP